MRLVRGQGRRGCFKVLFPPTELAQEGLVEPTTSSTCAGTRHLDARAGTTNCWAPIDSFCPEVPKLERMGSETVLAPPATPRAPASYSSYSSYSYPVPILLHLSPQLEGLCHAHLFISLRQPSSLGPSITLPVNPFSIIPSGTPVLCCPMLSHSVSSTVTHASITSLDPRSTLSCAPNSWT